MGVVREAGRGMKVFCGLEGGVNGADSLLAAWWDTNIASGIDK